jgi:hypothetical protein
MFKLDNNFLQSLGLGSLPVDEKNKLLQHIYETLEMRVGMKLAENMTDEQLDEFEAYIDRNDEPGALKWLETNFPNYKDVVADELEKLKSEVQKAAPQILAAAQAAPPAAPAQVQPQQPWPAQPAPAAPTAAPTAAPWPSQPVPPAQPERQEFQPPAPAPQPQQPAYQPPAAPPYQQPYQPPQDPVQQAPTDPAQQQPLPPTQTY